MATQDTDRSLVRRVFVTLLVISILSAAIATIASALLHQATILPEAMGNPPILTIMALAKKIAKLVT